MTTDVKLTPQDYLDLLHALRFYFINTSPTTAASQDTNLEEVKTREWERLGEIYTTFNQNIFTWMRENKDIQNAIR